MRRSPKSAKSKVESKPPVTRKTDEGNRVRDLEKRLAESQAQQRATAEILQVISRVHNNVQPVFDTIADSAARLCGADLGGVFLVQHGQLHAASTWSRLDPKLVATLRRVYPRPLDASTFVGRSIMERQVFQIADMTDPAAPQSAVGSSASASGAS